MATKKKYYVVWKGRDTGVFSDWKECEKNVKGFEGAQYKSFESRTEAENAFTQNAATHIYKKTDITSKEKRLGNGSFIKESIAVDAAWNTATLDMEYRGVEVWSGREIFRRGPYQDGTNNIGEFLAIVHALALMKQHNIKLPLYSDSRTAIAWVNKKNANSKLLPTYRNRELFDLMQRAEQWLAENKFTTPILKWETEDWGENPADFGRK